MPYTDRAPFSLTFMASLLRPDFLRRLVLGAQALQFSLDIFFGHGGLPVNAVRGRGVYREARAPDPSTDGWVHRCPAGRIPGVKDTTAASAGPLAAASAPAPAAASTAFNVLAAISFCHLLNDMMQSLLPALYPMLKTSYDLSFGQIGFLTFTFQVTASLLQPIVGAYTDRKSRPYSLAIGMGSTLVGLVMLALRESLWRTAPRGGAHRHGLVRVPP